MWLFDCFVIDLADWVSIVYLSVLESLSISREHWPELTFCLKIVMYIIILDFWGHLLYYIPDGFSLLYCKSLSLAARFHVSNGHFGWYLAFFLIYFYLIAALLLNLITCKILLIYSSNNGVANNVSDWSLFIFNLFLNFFQIHCSGWRTS